MARNWLRLVLAATIASAFVAPAAMSDAHAQSVSKKKAAKKADDAQGGDQQGEQKKKQDPIEAQKTIEAALKLIEAGKVDPAVNSLTTTLSAGNLPPGLMARALYYRGMGYRQQQKPGQAIADLTQALWIKGGLTDTDRSEALKQRSGAYADAGLAEPALVVASAKPLTTGSNPPAASSSSSWNPFGGFGNGFTLFNNGSQSASAPPPAPAPAPPVTVASVPTPSQPSAPTAVVKPVTSSWSSSTEVRATPVAMAPEAPSAPAAAAQPEGKFKVQLGLVRTDNEAQAIMSRVRGELANVFQAREPDIDQTVVGNFGSMYRVRVGPYASAGDGQAVCARLKGTGLDCLVVTQ